MTVPTRPVRRADRERRFDLRATALFFLLLAILLCVAGFVVRTAARTAGQRPAWAVALVLTGVAGAWLCRSGRRRRSAARYARRATLALEEAAEQVASAPVPEVAAPGTEYVELEPDGFEHAVAALCARDGCPETEVVGGPQDLGADVLARTPDGRRMVVQCKRYGDGHKVGSQDMQRFGGTCFTVHEAEVAVLVTTSDFTAPALSYAQQCGIVCVNGEELDAWSDGTGPAPWTRAAG
ncbi:restriction endonuclease [Streptomyces sp. NPDC090994]|uniref:restriction endonuclease n=1 Tax=Streptomyces sp. NPDC090994 TaxID=3365969 RepID=UPI0037F75778